MNITPPCGWSLEEAARARGSLRIAGVDEVGRGPLFGPVVAAAVILPKGCRLQGLNDSKKLTEKKRNELDVEIRASAIAWAIAEVDAATIDRINIRQASLEAMRLAVQQLALSPDFLLIDGRDSIDWPGPQQAVIHGDAISFSIAAATVTACWSNWTVSIPATASPSTKATPAPRIWKPSSASAPPRSTARAFIPWRRPGYNFLSLKKLL
jgi:hypothetical protein